MTSSRKCIVKLRKVIFFELLDIFFVADRRLFFENRSIVKNMGFYMLGCI